MNLLFIIVSLLIFVNAANSDIPAKKDIFTVHTFGGADPRNYVSNNFIFSVLDSYQELPEGESAPWKKYRHEQRGVIVTSDKQVFFFFTQDPSFLTILDQENNTHVLHLKKASKKISQIPPQPRSDSEISLTKENVFCASSAPWNTSEYSKAMWQESAVEPVTPTQFVEAMASWRRLSAADVPHRAIVSHSNEGPVIFPSSFTEMKNRPLKGVIVLKDGSVLQYFTRAEDAVSIAGVFYIRIEEAEQGSAGQPATRSESDSEGGDKPQPESDGRSR